MTTLAPVVDDTATGSGAAARRTPTQHEEKIMSTHVEWLRARSTSIEIAEPGEDMPDGQSLDAGNYGLVLSLDDVVVIEGTEDDLRKLLGRAARPLGGTPDQRKLEGSIRTLALDWMKISTAARAAILNEAGEPEVDDSDDVENDTTSEVYENCARALFALIKDSV